ncbi:MAG: cupin domain-containing protein [Microbacteriaceae bacterium]
MTDQKSSPGTETAVSPVALRHVAADAAVLPQAKPKLTSITGQFEAALTVWQSQSPTAVGVWECDAGEFPTTRPDYTEVCQILTGTATIVGDDGVTAEIGPGSLLVLPLGWAGTWVVHETLRKTYVIIAGASTA